MRKAAAERAYLEATSAAKQDTYRRVLDAFSLKRRNPDLSLTRAAKSSGTTLKTVRKYAGPALTIRSGRLDVKPTDRLPRPMRMLTARGEVVIQTTSSRVASRIGRFNNALRKYYVSNDSSALHAFAGKSIRSRGEDYEFVTDAKTLNRLARAGALHFLDIYASVSES